MWLTLPENGFDVAGFLDPHARSPEGFRELDDVRLPEGISETTTVLEFLLYADHVVGAVSPTTDEIASKPTAVSSSIARRESAISRHRYDRSSGLAMVAAMAQEGDTKGLLAITEQEPDGVATEEVSGHPDIYRTHVAGDGGLVVDDLVEG